MEDFKQPKLSYEEIVKMKEEQDAFWSGYHDFLRCHEDVLGEFCRRHGRRVLAYPKLPTYAPTRWVLKTKAIYDVRVDECKSCSHEEISRRDYNPIKKEGLQDLYDSGKYRYQVYYSSSCNRDKSD
uniref:Viral non-structural protein n=1 Tax=Milk vetch dwarf virus TaxID=67585 RepID=A0A2L2BHE1_9VIRU|nr:viral non-structural protein [Milk vetch dwarf virus]